jgi:hypothetical protein
MYLVSGVVCVDICKHAVSYLFGVLLAVSQCLKRPFQEILIFFCCVAFSSLFSEVSEEEYGVMRLTV